MPATYLVLAWPATWREGDSAAARLGAELTATPGWRLAVEAPGLRLWTRGPRPAVVTALVLPDAWLVGRLYAPAPALARTAPARLAAGLAARTWGGYVALLPDPGGGAAWVFRDASGAREAFTWTRDGLGLAADDLEGVPSPLWPSGIGVDWERVADVFARPLAGWGACPLAGVEALAPGELRPLRPGGAPVTVWRPSDAVARTPPADPRAALRAVVAEAVERVAASAGPSLLECSGGLDSSIVAGLLGRSAAGGQVLAALNQYVPQAEGDERAWARAVCARADIPLVEVEKAEGRLEIADFTALAQGARPAVGARDPVRERMFVAKARELGAVSVITGHGGDGVFYQMPSAGLAADLLRARGLAALADPRVLALARRFRRSIWSLWAEALGFGARHPPLTGAFWGLRMPRRFGRPAHPWLADLSDLSPGRRAQVEYLTFCQSKYESGLRSRSLDVLHPLLTQPVMELGLSISTWELVRGGRDRGLARDAFADVLPPEVAARRSKGELSTLYIRRLAASLDVVRPWLLEGALVEAGFLDAAAVDRALTPEALISRGDGLRLVEAVALEAWVRHWLGQAPSLAARAA